MKHKIIITLIILMLTNVPLSIAQESLLKGINDHLVKQQEIEKEFKSKVYTFNIEHTTIYKKGIKEKAIRQSGTIILDMPNERIKIMVGDFYQYFRIVESSIYENKQFLNIEGSSGQEYGISINEDVREILFTHKSERMSLTDKNNYYKMWNTHFSLWDYVYIY